MGDAWFQSIAVPDARLAPHAESRQPAWLWSADGSRILWCNAAAALALGIRDEHALERPRSPADPHGRQVSQLAPRLAPNGAARLERLRGFGARLGQLMTCACSQLEMQDGTRAILLVAMQPSVRAAPPAPASVAVRTPPEPPEANDGMANEATIDAARVVAPAPQPQRQDARGSRGAFDSSLPANGERQLIDSTVRPLRFVWQIDTAEDFSLLSDEFLRIAGARTAMVQGRAWSEVAQALDLDPPGRIAAAIARRETWSGIAVHWPIDGADDRARVELSGMPMFDGARNFAGYRGFGIYRHLAMPSDDIDTQNAKDTRTGPPASDPSHHATFVAAAVTPATPDHFSQAETEIVEPPQNVVPFPIANDTRVPSLSAVENHAFDEIARRLTGRLDDRQQQPTAAEPDSSHEREQLHEEEHADPAQTAQPAWLAAAATPPRGDSARDRMLLDLMPTGILIYRLDRLLYANRAFLERTGFDNLHALQEAGGLDALYVEPGHTSSSSASDAGMPLKIAPSADDRTPSDARLFSIEWDGNAAHALILQAAPSAAQMPPAAQPELSPQPTAPAQQADGAFGAILETATDGIVLFDRSGAIVSCNRSAEALFGITAPELQALNFADLFAAESQRTVLDYFEGLDGSNASNALDHGREVLGRERSGGFIPLSMTMGHTGDDRERFFAVFRDLSQLKKNESELLNARRRAERATTAKADALARISHEIRGPLNTVIGFANVMIEERFGALGNERYAEYLKDIRASGERVIAILDDIINISSIETGNIDLRPVSQNLNEVIEQCVGVLQPQANRERVIIRTSLAHALPQVMADTQALRQIAMNIVTSSIRCSKAGGQVIVSTALGDNGGAILRVRDTGRGLSETELAAAMGTHRTTSPSERIGTDRGAIDLSLARALAEANRAKFQIKTTENFGTLIEVAFANTRALAG